MATFPDDLELQLDAFDRSARQAAFDALLEQAAAGAVDFPPPGRNVNLHAHTFYSYHAEGYSPLHFAWAARRAGLAAAGIVDFDVLDGVDEFLGACGALGLRGCAGIETRVFVPEFSDREINSPGEPGIAYHMGVGFTAGRVSGPEAKFLASLKETAQRRNREMLERVNAFLDPMTLDYEADVLPLTPAGGATERHVCLALASKAAERFKGSGLESFWVDKLGPEAAGLDYPTGPRLQALIRSRTMKRGGVGYAAPDRGSFPTLEAMNRFVLALGAIPTVTWLDGASAGEQAIGELLEVCRSSGAAALNIIPDRNYTPGVRDRKLENLYAVVERARCEAMPVFIGTEMNSPGLKFVDDLATPELAPLAEDFLQGAAIACAHTVLQAGAGLGYLSPWALRHWPDPASRNTFFAEVGRRYDPRRPDCFRTAAADSSPDDILRLAAAAAEGGQDPSKEP